MASKPDTERKIYVLPSELVERVRAYQQATGLTSEVEAVRRLLDMALQMRDTLDDLLNKLRLKFVQEKDLRILARDILVNHMLVTAVNFVDGDLVFYMGAEDRGKLTKHGRMFIGSGGYDNWDPWKPREKEKSSWDKPKGGSDLDDDIPF